MDGSSTPLLLKLNFSALNTTANTVALQFHPTILRDLTPNQEFEPDTGILHASLSDAPTITFQYWITISSILPTFTQDRQEASYKVIYFTPFSTKAVWTRLYPDQPIPNTISARLTDMDTLLITYLSSSMSTDKTYNTPQVIITHQKHLLTLSQ